jgi:DNA-binding HxlR family transcriptional regulator
LRNINKIKGVNPAQCNEAIFALRDSLEIWGGKWKLMILLYLTIKKEDKNLFMQILRDLPNISAKMLSKELKDLEANQLITRTIHDSKPITVEYSITEYGQSFIPIAHQLIKWGMDHRQVIKNLSKNKKLPPKQESFLISNSQ